MIDEELTELSSFNFDLQKGEKLEFDADEINKIAESGFKTVTVKIYGSSKQASGNLGNDEKLFENIKKTQSLPDNIVYDFLNCKGSLAEIDLLKRLK